MILLDTNVVSEPMRPTPDQGVIAWIDSQSLETLFLSAITVAELRSGVSIMPSGKRQKFLHQSLESELLARFTGRILPFDLACAAAYADVLAQTRKQGVVLGMADALIAATAKTYNLRVATRDVRPFRAAGMTVVNPWETD